MATATIPLATSVKTQATDVWWRRKDPYVLAPITALHVIVIGPALHWLRNATPWVVDSLLTGLVIAQVFLLATWIAFGGLKTLPRLGLVSIVFLCGLSSYVIAARTTLHEALDSLLAGGLVGGLMVSFFATMLLPLRRMAGWRIDFDDRPYRQLRGRKGQVGLLDLAALSCAIGVPLTSIRLLEQSSATEGSNDWLSLMGILAFTVATAAPASYFALSWRRPSLVLVAAAVTVLFVSWCQSFISLWIDALDIFGDYATVWGMGLEILAFHAGVAATCMTTFAVLRWFGLKLIAVFKVDGVSHAPGKPGIKRSVDVC